MASSAGPPTRKIPYMTPFPIAHDPPPPRSIPDLRYPDKTVSERAAARFSLADKTAIVTGGAQGLGLVSARSLIEHGLAHLAIFDVDDEKGAAAVEHLCSLHNAHSDDQRDHKCSVSFWNVDVTDEAAVNKHVALVSEGNCGIDVLLCFAGITGCQLATEYDINDWRKIFDVNIHGSFLVARAVARYELFDYIISISRETIKRKTTTSIVFIASMSEYIVNTPQPHPAYAVSKAGVHHLARSMAAEWVGHNIRVNSISPGIMNTRLSAGEAQAKLRRLWLQRSPMGIGDPEDLTGAIILLCSDAGKFMTGTDIKIDGGYTMF